MYSPRGRRNAPSGRKDGRGEQPSKPSRRASERLSAVRAALCSKHGQFEAGAKIPATAEKAVCAVREGTAVQQQQDREHQKLEKQNAEAARKQQLEQRHQRQTEKMQQKQSEQRQRMEERKQLPPPKKKGKH
jgi:hypothetical protein